MERGAMKQIRFKKFALTLCALLLCGTAMAQERTRPDIDVSIPRVQIRPPVAGPMLTIYEKLPGRFYFNADAETSLRLETNPYQAPRGSDPFTEATNAFRVQTNASMGYSLTNKTRVNASYFMMKDQFNDFTPYHLDSTINSFGVGLEHDIWQKNRWMLRGSVQARLLLLPKDRGAGDLIPSLTLIRGLGKNGWAYANASLDLSRPHLPIGDVDTLSQIYTFGSGYQIPYDSGKTWKKPFEGTSFSLSSTYTMGAAMNETPQAPANYHSIIVTAEVAKPIKRNVPISLFVRAEPVFNFGTPEHDNFGLSGVNFRLFGGIRASLSKPAVAMVDLEKQITNSDEQSQSFMLRDSLEGLEEIGDIADINLEPEDQLVAGGEAL